MSTDVIAPADVPSEPVTTMETEVQPTTTTDETPAPVNGNTTEDGPLPATTENKGEKRKRPTKKSVEIDETSVSNSRPRRTLTKREDPPPPAPVVNGSGRKSKTQPAPIEDDEERDKTVPTAHDVADVVWVKMGGHPWWPSIVIRDPNDSTSSFTKVVGNAPPKRTYFVSFYGSTADFAWVPDSTVIPYQGVEAFTTYAQKAVDKAVTKNQKEQLTERFQLKVTMSRREDWESAVKEADLALSQTSEKRLEDIEPKLQFYTSKTTSSGRKSKAKVEEPVESPVASTEEEDEDDDDEEEEEEDVKPARKTASLKAKSNDGATPPAKRRYVRKSTGTNENTTTNGSHDDDDSPKKRGRPRISKPAVITTNNNGQLKKPIKKPQAFANKVESPSTINVLNGQHHRFETRVGFLSPYEEQEIFDIVDQLRTNKSFDEVEQLAKQRFEQILCANLNKTQVDIPQDCMFLLSIYSFN